MREVVVGGHIVILSPFFAYIIPHFCCTACLVSLIAPKDLLARLPYSHQVPHGNLGIKIVSTVGHIELDWLAHPVRFDTGNQFLNPLLFSEMFYYSYY